MTMPRVRWARVIAAALLTMLYVPRPADAQPDVQPVRILLVHGIVPDAPEIAAFTQQLRLTVRSEVAQPVEFYQEYLDLERFPGRRAALASYFDDKYRGFRVDAVVAIGSVALRFAATDLRRTLPEVPIVFGLTIESLMDRSLPMDNVTGRLANFPFQGSLALAQSLQPDAEHVAIVGGVARVDSVAVAVAMQAVTARAPSLDVILLRGISYSAVLERLRRLPPRTIVLATSFTRDPTGHTFIPAEIIGPIAKASSAPVYGYTRVSIGQGIVGGAAVLPDQEGTAVGKLVMRVVRRAPNEVLPHPARAVPTFIADWRELQRWGLSEDRLPAGTLVINRAPGVWERYRAQILASLAVMSFQTLLIALLLAERERRRRAQIALEDQVAYEQLIAELTADAVRHVHQEDSPALDDALARIARYAGASGAVLVQYAEDPTRPSCHRTWPVHTLREELVAALRFTPRHPGAVLEIPLMAEDACLGSLTCYAPDANHAWPQHLLPRLDAAATLLAGAMTRAHALRAVRAGEELNRAVLASLTAEIAIIDRDGTIIRVNDSWCSLARQGGMPAGAETFVGANYLEECRRAEEQGCVEAGEVRIGIESVLADAQCPFRYEYRWTSPEPRWFELRVDCLDHEAGGAIITHLDISDRRLADLKAEETRRQVAHLGRVAMIGELAATVSHELRQPLAAIRANAESGALLLERYPGSVDEAKQIFQDIIDDDIRAAAIIDRTRMLLRNEAPQTAVVDVNEICRRAVQLLERTAMLRRARLQLSLEARIPTVVGDPVQLEQVVLNLVINALDAMSTSTGVQTVDVRTQERDGDVEISIQDSGPGLPPEVREHLFESFYSTKQEGLGMGLVIVRSIVERYRGRVSADNSDDGGAVFRVRLPLAWSAEERVVTASR
jgi:signal transduction histidine kinase